MRVSNSRFRSKLPHDSVEEIPKSQMVLQTSVEPSNLILVKRRNLEACLTPLETGLKINETDGLKVSGKDYENENRYLSFIYNGLKVSRQRFEAKKDSEMEDNEGLRKRHKELVVHVYGRMS
ncbi:unnamed protein product [Thlaspi arvense]|uniref:Uncharacterized protein n=1 Tax=Thlaspi arvense TaxID=13288 RepID=A0AAU9STD8_THLAR|nr:unnamed protein product [Thlaspi arvense]